MTLAKFIAESGLADLGEVQKVFYFAFYYLEKGTVLEFSAADGAKWVRDQGTGNPNTSRLGDRLKRSRDCVTGTKPGLYRLHHKFLTTLEAKFPQLSEKSQEIADDGTILPPVLYDKTRAYIEIQQNPEFQFNVFRFK